MKINWEMVISVAVALIIVSLLDKFVLSKIGGESDDYETEDYTNELY